ncbi:MAG: cytochrome c3 family protein [Thermoanaerobaculia bacterium]
MTSFFGHARHLVRLAGLFALGIVAFLLLRALAVPPGFGLYGHYRAGALDDNRNQAFVHAGRAACAECHDEVVAKLAGGSHQGVGCEACHGALARHVADPDAQAPAKLEVPKLCLVCHRVNRAKPRGFPQIDPTDHAEGEPCLDCHSPHSPA